MMNIDTPKTAWVDGSDQGILQLWAEVFRCGVLDMAEALCSGNHGASFWMNSPDTHPGSFLWLCGLFGYDCNRVRKLVITRKEEIIAQEKRGKKK